jgi:hypothetical protein
MATRRASTSRKKTARKKKGKPLRQSWRDLVSWWTRQQVASAKRATQKVSDGKARVKAAEDKAKAKAEEDKLAAAKKAQKDAEKAARRAQQQAAATLRAQQRAAQRGPVTVGGTITATGQTGAATLCGHPHITDPRQKCGNPVLPGTPTCAAGHPQGGSSFGGLRPSQIVNQHTPQFGAAARGNP